MIARLAVGQDFERRLKVDAADFYTAFARQQRRNTANNGEISKIAVNINCTVDKCKFKNEKSTP